MSVLGATPEPESIEAGSEAVGWRIIVMGVSGCGKTTVGRRLAQALSLPFADADSLHPATNVTKMSAGVPLTDRDREPWLGIVGDVLAARPGVIACSALRRAYRDRLRSETPAVWFLHLDGPESIFRSRMRARTDHFMPASLLGSQLVQLEALGTDELGATVDIVAPLERIVDQALGALETPGQ